MNLYHGEFNYGRVEIIVSDQGNLLIPSYVACKFTNQTVQADIKFFPFTLVYRN